MRKLGVVCCALLLALATAAACSGDDKKHAVSVAGAGGGELGGGGGDSVNQGGGSSKPTAGEGGALLVPSAGAGGATPVAEGGAGMSAGGQPGTAGAGGAPGVDCPAQMGNFTYQCGDVVALWKPIWNSTSGRFELDVSSLPFPIASGSVAFFYNSADAVQCGSVAVQVNGDIVTATVPLQFPPITVNMSSFSLVDVCGNHHDYDPLGAPSCFELQGNGSFGDWPLTCHDRFSSDCPQTCT